MGANLTNALGNVNHQGPLPPQADPGDSDS